MIKHPFLPSFSPDYFLSPSPLTVELLSGCRPATSGGAVTDDRRGSPSPTRIRPPLAAKCDEIGIPEEISPGLESDTISIKDQKCLAYVSLGNAFL